MEFSAPCSAVVVGAAGGIGSHIAAQLVARGVLVTGLDRLSLDAARACGVLAGTHPAEDSVAYEHVTVGGVDDIGQAFAVAAQRGTLRHVISTAGGATPEEVANNDTLTLDVQQFGASVQENLTAQFAIAREAVRHLRELEGDRSVTLTSSINGLDGVGLPAYSAAKAALTALARNLAVMEGPHGLRVNAVAPGTVVTPRTQALYADTPSHFDALAASTALGRTATPVEVARAYVALALDLTAVTGQTLVVDAGQLARWR